ncbi:hypothetical protein JHN49_13510 [Streptomyces sp. MBT57]|nr:hypothetical protein [Streptomyces sp. MBT57]
MLLLGSAASVVAGWAASRRSQAQAQAVRKGIELTIERKLWDPVTVVILWLAAAAPSVAAVAVVAAWFVEAHSAPGTGGARAGVEAITLLLVLTIGSFIAAGLPKRLRPSSGAGYGRGPGDAITGSSTVLRCSISGGGASG